MMSKSHVTNYEYALDLYHTKADDAIRALEGMKEQLMHFGTRDPKVQDGRRRMDHNSTSAGASILVGATRLIKRVA